VVSGKIYREPLQLLLSLGDNPFIETQVQHWMYMGVFHITFSVLDPHFKTVQNTTPTIFDGRSTMNPLIFPRARPLRTTQLHILLRAAGLRPCRSAQRVGGEGRSSGMVTSSRIRPNMAGKSSWKMELYSGTLTARGYIETYHHAMGGYHEPWACLEWQQWHVIQHPVESCEKSSGRWWTFTAISSWCLTSQWINGGTWTNLY
jgi:hypothetical protein